MITKLAEKYKKEALPKMKEKFGYKNVMAVPKIVKVTINTGFGRQIVLKGADERKKFTEGIMEDISQICGQKPVLTVAKKSIASFKVREGMIMGCKVTLRGKKMYDFLDRLVNLTLPRTRDFKGIPLKSVDQNGNLSLAIREHIVFPEVSPDKIKSIFGLEVTATTTAKNHEQGLELFRLLGFPFAK
jgi:large subunit ribosomal protein L5